MLPDLGWGPPIPLPRPTPHSLLEPDPQGTQPLVRGTHALPRRMKPVTHTQAKGASGSALSCVKSPLQPPTLLAADHAHAPTHAPTRPSTHHAHLACSDATPSGPTGPPWQRRPAAAGGPCIPGASSGPEMSPALQASACGRGSGLSSGPATQHQSPPLSTGHRAPSPPGGAGPAALGHRQQFGVHCGRGDECEDSPGNAQRAGAQAVKLAVLGGPEFSLLGGGGRTLVRGMRDLWPALPKRC